MICNNCGRQSEPGDKFCQKCGTPLTVHKNFKENSLNWFKTHKKLLLISGGVILLLLIIIIAAAADDGSSTPTPAPKSDAQVEAAKAEQENSYFPATTTVDQAKIVSSVVNIWCSDGNDGISGGSGTLWTSEGLILTNAHIIPQDRDENPIPSHCLVMLPNAQGGVKDTYMAEPIVIPTLSKEYDLAFFKIDGPYTDDYGVDHGPYPTTFPDYPDFGCKDNDVTLSEPVTVFGYPEISNNGNSLTITTGVASSLPGDGTIITSAKVSHGDSGGLAVDEYGCMIGIPSQVSGDEYDSLGIIKSNDTIDNFLSDVQDAINSSDKDSNDQ